jgi:hypothetical protein
MSVKDPGNTFDLSLKGQRTVTSFGNFLCDMYRTLIFGFGFGVTLYISQEKFPNDGKVLCPLGLKSNVLPGSLTDISG